MIQLEVWGPYALFSRPELKVERMSYDVPTPSAARGIVEALYFHPGLRWVIDRIYVMSPIRFLSIRRNEVKSKISASTVRHAAQGGRPAPVSGRPPGDRPAGLPGAAGCPLRHRGPLRHDGKSRPLRQPRQIPGHRHPPDGAGGSVSIRRIWAAASFPPASGAGRAGPSLLSLRPGTWD